RAPARRGGCAALLALPLLHAEAGAPLYLRPASLPGEWTGNAVRLGALRFPGARLLPPDDRLPAGGHGTGAPHPHPPAARGALHPAAPLRRLPVPPARLRDDLQLRRSDLGPLPRRLAPQVTGAALGRDGPLPQEYPADARPGAGPLRRRRHPLGPHRRLVRRRHPRLPRLLRLSSAALGRRAGIP